MTDPIELGSLAYVMLKLGGGMTLGVVAGYCYFLMLWRSVSELQRQSAGRALFSFALRFALLAVALVVLARWGALPLLAGALGIVIGRRLMILRLGEPS